MFKNHSLPLAEQEEVLLRIRPHWLSRYHEVMLFLVTAFLSLGWEVLGITLMKLVPLDWIRGMLGVFTFNADVEEQMLRAMWTDLWYVVMLLAAGMLVAIFKNRFVYVLSFAVLAAVALLASVALHRPSWVPLAGSAGAVLMAAAFAFSWHFREYIITNERIWVRQFGKIADTEGLPFAVLSEMLITEDPLGRRTHFASLVPVVRENLNPELSSSWSPWPSCPMPEKVRRQHIKRLRAYTLEGVPQAHAVAKLIHEQVKQSEVVMAQEQIRTRESQLKFLQV